MENNIFKISPESIIELVRKLIETKPGKCNLYETAFQVSRYIHSNLPKNVTVEVSDAQEQTYKFKHKGVLRHKQDNEKRKYHSLKIEVNSDIEFFVEAILDDTCKTESIIHVPVRFWSPVLGLIPWRFEISQRLELKHPKYVISYGRKNEVKSREEISLSDYAELIALYKHFVNEENRQRNINAQLIVDKENNEMLVELMEANKIEKKLC